MNNSIGEDRAGSACCTRCLRGKQVLIPLVGTCRFLGEQVCFSKPQIHAPELHWRLNLFANK